MITHELLKSWRPCEDGYKRFCELFPNGATLTNAITGLVNDGHDDWSKWLFDKCREKKVFLDETEKGYLNTGNRNTGNRNTGDWNTGYLNTGDWNTGDGNTGYRNTGDWNTGDGNTGNRNTGDWNTGDWNTGDGNTGYRNTGDWNTGDRNTGNRNTGYRNTGNRNTGDWNTGDGNTGFFNTITPDDILIFNQPCKRSMWDSIDKPSFIYFDLIEFIDEAKMTDQEKIDHPTFFTIGGYLKKHDYKEAFKKSYEKASEADKAKIFNIPNFDANVFFEISGIDLRGKK